MKEREAEAAPEEGIYTYYVPVRAAMEKRDAEAAPEEGIYTYYAIPKAAVKVREEVSYGPSKMVAYI